MKKHFVTIRLLTLFLFGCPNFIFAQTDGQYIVTVRLDNIRAERQGSGDGPLWGFVDVHVWQLNEAGQKEKEIYPTAGTTRIWDKPNEGSACRDNPLKRSWSRSTGGGGLANMSAPSGTFIGFATAPGSTAADGNGRNGVYTSALLQHIRKPNLSVLSLFTTVNGTVKTTTNNQQIPWLNSSLSEDLFLAR